MYRGLLSGSELKEELQQEAGAGRGRGLSAGGGTVAGPPGRKDPVTVNRG